MRELGSSPLMRHVGFAGSRNTEVHLRSVCPVEQHEAAKNKENPMPKGQSLQDPVLNACRKVWVPVCICLVNGVNLRCQLDSFDQWDVGWKYIISDIVYYDVMSTVMPSEYE